MAGHRYNCHQVCCRSYCGSRMSTPFPIKAADGLHHPVHLVVLTWAARARSAPPPRIRGAGGRPSRAPSTRAVGEEGRDSRRWSRSLSPPETPSARPAVRIGWCIDEIHARNPPGRWVSPRRRPPNPATRPGTGWRSLPALGPLVKMGQPGRKHRRLNRVEPRIHS